MLANVVAPTYLAAAAHSDREVAESTHFFATPGDHSTPSGFLHGGRMPTTRIGEVDERDDDLGSVGYEDV
jgi:hypothetical protein